MLPDHAENIGLILELDSIASRYKLALTNVDVSAEDVQSAKTPREIQSAVGATAPYAAVTLHFSSQGTYENFRAFMHDLEQSLRIVDLSMLTLTSDRAAVAGGSGAYNFDATIKTYWLK